MPSVAPTDEEETARNYDQYRDTRTHRLPTGSPPDRWIVFHLHINENTRVFDTVNQRTRIGIEHVTMFHAQESRMTRRQGWRADGYDTGGANARGAGFHCDEPTPINRNNLWYVGAAQGSMPVGFYTRFQVWAWTLFNTGYMSTPGISPILSGATFRRNGDIDLTNQPAFLQWGDESFEFGGANPYSISFRIRRDTNDPNGYAYEFGILDPGNPN